MPKTARVQSVAAVNRLIQQRLDDIGPLLVEGELTQVRVAASGHLYAALKERDDLLNLVMWRSAVVRNGRLPEEGTRVQVRGSLALYAPRGSHQLICSRITALGAGDLAARFEALKEGLRAEGLFEEAAKRPLPWLPRGIGLATAAGSAALADLREGLERRFPGMPLVHAPCQVQGAGAGASIIAALAALNAREDIDLILCGRGGGSLEDLWAFNEEAVVRAVAASHWPIIVAVGHESDTCLAELAADRRAKTPSAAAELAVPERADLVDTLAQWQERLQRPLREGLARERQRLAAYARHRALARPGAQILLRQQRCDEQEERLGRALRAQLASAQATLARVSHDLTRHHPQHQLQAAARRLEELTGMATRALARQLTRAGEGLAQQAARLDALSPLRVLGRGYSVVFDAQGRALTEPAQAPLGSQLHIRLAGGELGASVNTHPPLSRLYPR